MEKLQKLLIRMTTGLLTALQTLNKDIQHELFFPMLYICYHTQAHRVNIDLLVVPGVTV